jgi:hypothetical protein
MIGCLQSHRQFNGGMSGARDEGRSPHLVLAGMLHFCNFVLEWSVANNGYVCHVLNMVQLFVDYMAWP